jgi:hypothetical protein
MAGMKILALLAALCCGPALAASTSTDFTDLWFNPNEEGWGVNVIHQRDILFVTLFVYGPDNKPTWYVGSDVRLASANDGVLTYSGTLYRTTGPYFGGAFNENNVSNTNVGTVTFTASQINAATLSYIAEGVAVTKAIQRQTWAAETLTGEYGGFSIGDWSNCGGRNGHTESGALLSVTHSSTNVVTVREAGVGYTCNYSGAYSQAGRTGTVSGTGTCSDNFNPSFIMSDIQINANGITMRMTAESGSCRMSGRMGGIRR